MIEQSASCVRGRRRRASERCGASPAGVGLAFSLLISLLPGCAESIPDRAPPPLQSGGFAIRGGWLASREGYALDSRHGSEALAEMSALGANAVAIGHPVQMPRLAEPKLVYGSDDAALRGALRRTRQAGMTAFLLPRIESPDFFKPPFPFRADIQFSSSEDWASFHRQVESMVLHYAALAAEEKVAVFGLGLELKHSVRRFPGFWRGLASQVREVFPGKVTYSANWYDEWKHIEFWDALDYIGVGAYFELKGAEPEGRATVAQLAARWEPILGELHAVSRRFDRPVLFTEVGYTGYRDCAERPWEWAGKGEKGVAIDHQAQARAVSALCRVVRGRPWLSGIYWWTFYTHGEAAAPWEYTVQGRPAAEALRHGFRK